MSAVAWLREQEQKELLRFVTIGSVDDGKSTLIGRLLHDAHGVYVDQLDAVRRASVKGSTRGAGSTAEIDFSLFTDGLAAEREQGITIDVAYRYFATPRRKFIIADTPGHVQYTRNMATGASTAEVAIILVDARLGVLEQTRRHARIAGLLGIRHVIACVNKMDLALWDRARFEQIRADLASISGPASDVYAIPISALRGDNVVVPSDSMAWWHGPTLLEHLESVPVGRPMHEGPLRLPVQLVLRPGLGYRGFAGRLSSGVVRPGDEVVIVPSGKRTRVVAVDVAGKEVSEAFAPMNVALRLAEEIDVSRGDMIVDPRDRPKVETDFEADLVWMNERPLDPARTYLLKHTTRTVRAELAAEGRIALNDIAKVRVKTRAPIFFDAYATNRATGAFIVIDSVTNDTVAAGMILGAARSLRAVSGGERTQVSDAERAERLGHRGAIIRIARASVDEARTAAFALERELFDAHYVATVVDTPEVASACARSGLVAVVVEVGTDERTEVNGKRLVGTDAKAVLLALA
jgi:bifunctional enzyme CysN/CysC